MDDNLKKSVWNQFGAAIDTLDDALKLCPEHLWETKLWDDDDDPRYGQFWYIAYHTLVWTDLFLGGSYEDFQPPAPFIRGKLPEKPYTKEEIQSYLKQLRQKGKEMIAALNDERAHQICVFAWMEPSYLELQLYSMRHIQEHAAHLNLVLGHRGVTGQDWVAQARDV